MKFTTIFILLEAIFVVFLLFQSIQVSSQEVDDEREFNYIPGSPVGPEHWGELHEEWRACSNKTGQSPIDITHALPQNLFMLNTSYKPSHATLVNRGHDIMLRWDNESAGTIVVNETQYTLRQLHWHSPSEHTIDGFRYPLEGHLVHQNAAEQTTVIAIMYMLGKADPFLSELEPVIKKIADEEAREEDVGIIDPNHLKFGHENYYRYMGSLTTPPCTDGVVWTIIKDVLTVSIEQVKLLRRAVHDDSENNARPIQPSNNRPIFSTSKSSK